MPIAPFVHVRDGKVTRPCQLPRNAVHASVSTRLPKGANLESQSVPTLPLGGKAENPCLQPNVY